MGKWKNENEEALRIRVYPGDYIHGKPAQWQTVKVGDVVDLGKDPNERFYAKNLRLTPVGLLKGKGKKPAKEEDKDAKE